MNEKRLTEIEIKIVKDNGLTVPTIDAPADEKPPHY